MRFYASGRPLARSSRLLEAQARAFANQSKRLAVARRMYEMRFPGEDVSALSMQQLRGREGARVRAVYAEHAQRTGVQWRRRSYKPGEIQHSDEVNRALSSANSCLYGVISAVVHGLGMSPGLGFVHVGHDQSFIYDVADLFKATTTIPASFDVVAQGSQDPENDVRRVLRDQLVRSGLLENCVKQLRELFLTQDEVLQEPELAFQDSMSLWSGFGERRMGTGQNYAGDSA